MDWEWEKGNGSSLDGHFRNLREEMAEMSLRIELLERAIPLGCEESGSSSGGEEWAWWSGAWWVKTKMRMNSANRRKVHWVISQSLGKSSERKHRTPKMMGQGGGRNWREREVDLKRSWRARNEQASVEKETTNFRKASEAEGACVDTLGYSSGFQILKARLLECFPDICRTPLSFIFPVTAVHSLGSWVPALCLL